MDSAILTTVLVISLATNGIVLGLLLAGRIGWMSRRGSRTAASSTFGPPAPLVPVMARPTDDADRGRRAWMERADALVTRSRQVGQPTTVVLLEVLPPPPNVSSVDADSSQVVLESAVPLFLAMTRAHDLIFEDSATTFQLLLADTDEAMAGAFVDRCKVELERAHPDAELMAAWAIASDGGLDVALRLAEARLAGRREGWIRSMAVR